MEITIEFTANKGKVGVIQAKKQITEIILRKLGIRFLVQKIPIYFVQIVSKAF
jgi:hypothetical protein